MSSLHPSLTESAFDITELVVPDSIDSPNAADFIEMAKLRSAVEAEQRGAAAEVFTAEEMLLNWQDKSSPMSGLVAKLDGRVVARGSLGLPINAAECWIAVAVLPEFRNRGIGTAIYERLELMVQEAGRSTIQNQTSFPAGVVGASISAPTGFGSVPRDIESTQFLQRHRFSLEQVGRFSRLRLPLDEGVLSTSIAEAAISTNGYRAISWQGRTPEEWLDGIAHLRTKMSTEAPSAGMEQSEDVWTAERVRAVDELWATSSRTPLTTAVVHEATGQLAGFTVLEVPAESSRPVEQVDTLVLQNHRGKRLGMLLKLRNLAALATSFPERDFVETMNAEDNRHMLEVNEAIGFAPICYAARWRKNLS